MMTRYAFAASLLVLTANLPSGAMAAEYSADTLQTSPGAPPQTGRIFVGKETMRTESQVAGRRIVEIVSRADGNVRTFMPGEGVYMEMKVDPSLLPAMRPPEAPCKPTPQLACAKVGDALISAMKAERWDITPAGAPAAVRIWWDATRKFPLRQEFVDGRVMQATLRGIETYEGAKVENWDFVFLAPDGTFARTMALFSAELGMPILTQQSNGSVFKLSNIKVGAPDAALFKLPEGLRKIERGHGPMPQGATSPAPVGQPQAAQAEQPPQPPAPPQAGAAKAVAPKAGTPETGLQDPAHPAAKESTPTRSEPQKP